MLAFDLGIPGVQGGESMRVAGDHGDYVAVGCKGGRGTDRIDFPFTASDTCTCTVSTITA
jgi:hypothetical protein